MFWQTLAEALGLILRSGAIGMVLWGAWLALASAAREAPRGTGLPALGQPLVHDDVFGFDRDIAAGAEILDDAAHHLA